MLGGSRASVTETPGLAECGNRALVTDTPGLADETLEDSDAGEVPGSPPHPREQEMTKAATLSIVPTLPLHVAWFK